MTGIYLDHNASCPPDPVVVDAMLPWLRDGHANPHSPHAAGRRAMRAVEDAARSIADLIGANEQDIVFCSGATEANNTIMRGVLHAGWASRGLATSTIEHKSVDAVAHLLAGDGVECFSLPVDRNGVLRPAQLEAVSERLQSFEASLVSVVHGNNEIGTVQNLSTLSLAVAGTSTQLHVDASQSAGIVPIDVQQTPVDFLVLSSHKLYGPQGIGAFYAAPGARDQLQPLLYGGDQQQSLRPGTIAVFLAVGFGEACRLAKMRRDSHSQHLNSMTELFLSLLQEHNLEFEVLGSPHYRLPGLISLRLLQSDSEKVLNRLDGQVHASPSSACTAGTFGPSHVLTAIGLNDSEAQGVIRLGFGRTTTAADVVAAARHLVSAAQ